MIFVPSRRHAARDRWMRSSSAINTFAPLSTSAKSISSSVHHEFIDTEIAPIDVIAANDMIHSGKLRIAIATRSPLTMP